MATTKTFAELRLATLKKAKDSITGLVTTGTSETVFSDTTLADKRVMPTENQYVLFLTGDNAGEYRKIAVDGFNSTAYAYTVTRAFTNVPQAFSEEGEGEEDDIPADTYIVTSFCPDDLADAINNARLRIYPYVHKVIDIERLFTQTTVRRFTKPSEIKSLRQVMVATGTSLDVEQNVLSNPDFQSWSGGSPVGWDTTECTVSEETDEQFVPAGSKCVKLVIPTLGGEGATVAGIVQVHTSFDIAASTLAGKKCSLKVRVYSLNSHVYMVGGFYGTESDPVITTAKHNGEGWQWLESTFTMPPDILTAGVYVLYGVIPGTTEAETAPATIYVSNASLLAATEHSNFSYDPVFNWKQIGETIELGYAILPNRMIRTIGMGYLEEVTTDASTMTISEPQTDLLYEYALLYLYRQSLSQMPDQTSPYLEAQISFCEHNIERLKREVGMKLIPLMNGIPDYD